MESARTATPQANNGKSAQIEKKEKRKKEIFQGLFCFGFLVLLWVGLMWLTQHAILRQGPLYLRGAQRESFHLNLRLKADRKPVSAREAGCGRTFREQFLQLPLAVAFLLSPCCRITCTHHPLPSQLRGESPFPRPKRGHTRVY